MTIKYNTNGKKRDREDNEEANEAKMRKTDECSRASQRSERARELRRIGSSAASLALDDPHVPDEIPETERNGQMITLHNIPVHDDIIFKILKYAGLGRGLRLRLNKTMEERMHNLLKLKNITLSSSAAPFDQLQYQLSMDGHVSMFRHILFENVHRLTNGLIRWSENTYAHKNLGAAINALCHFVADELIVNAGVPFKLPHIDATTLLSMSKNIREVRIDHICTSLTGNDLCTLRNNLLVGDHKMESFTVVLNEGVTKEFMQICFDVSIIENHSAPALSFSQTLSLPHALSPFGQKRAWQDLREQSTWPSSEASGVGDAPAYSSVKRNRRTVVYGVAARSNRVQLYTYAEGFPSNTMHFENELKTEVEGNRVSFTKLDADMICQAIISLPKIKLNSLYTM